MARTRFRPDAGLTARMGLTIFLLGLLYVALVVGLWFLFEGTAGGVALAVLLSGGLLWGQWFFSDRLALRAMRGQVVTPQQAPDLHAMVDRLCALADMPKPQVAVAASRLPNAFATGRSPRRAVVCVTTGLLQTLDARELEAVLAHELAHVAHRDVTVMTVASVVGVLAGLMTRMFVFGGMGGSRRNQNSAPVHLVVLLVSMVVYAVSFLLIRVLSRYRELSADRSGAYLTGQPSDLASALVKISGSIEGGRIPTRDLREAEPYNAFFFSPATTRGFDLTSLFSTHPSTERRLQQLARISADLGRPLA